MLCGDIVPVTSADLLTEVLARFCQRWSYVFYVPGNHEYYSQRTDAVRGRFRKVERELRHLTIFDSPRLVTMFGKQILGGTMWFCDHPLNRCHLDFPDFKHIVGLEPWVYQEHKHFMKLLHDSLHEGAVVFSHHAPLYESVTEYWRGNDWNRFYLTDCSREIQTIKPAVWCHGHMHSRMDYQFEKTRVVCNPFGNPRQNTGFDEALVIEVP